jgi:hypothetical protein
MCLQVMDVNMLISEFARFVTGSLKDAELEGGRATAALLVTMLSNEQLQVAVVLCCCVPG